MLVRGHATLLQRPIAIHVFDAQQDGPTFGARALLALTALGGPLHGLKVQFQHHIYDWNDTAPLARLPISKDEAPRAFKRCWSTRRAA